MNHYLLSLIQKYKKKGVLIDTNLALLYIVGSYDTLRLRKHSRTQIFSEDDFDRFSKFVNFFDSKIASPHVLTETGNLLGADDELRGVFASYIASVTEIFLHGKELTASRAFVPFGLTDTGILEIAKNKYLVATDDGPLEGLLRHSGVDVVSMSQIRSI